MSEDRPTPPMNPYGAPIAMAVEVQPSPTGQVAESTIRVLERTRGWVFFLALMGALASAGSAFVTFGLVLISTQPEFEMIAGPELVIAWATYPIMSVVYAIVTVKLFQYGIRIGRLRSQPTVGRLDHALEAQRSFWNIIGAATVIMVFVIGVVMVWAVRTAIMQA